jgi:hypothetical protein
MNVSAIAVKVAKQSEFFLRKNAPTILTGAGIVGFIASTALTIKATNEAMLVLPEISEKVRKVKRTEVDKNYSEKDKMEDLIKVYATSSVDLIKLYGPTLAVGSAAIICVLSAHGMMLKRQASLVAAYSALDAGFKAYRSRVAEKFGEDEEIQLYRGVRTVKSSDDEGKPCQIIDEDDPRPSPYGRFFDPGNRNWTKTPGYNLMFLRSQEKYANDRLQANGFVFLNEVYEAIGMERTQAGQMVGWRKEKTGLNDGYVDFGMYSIGDENCRAFVNGIENTVFLDFNVDGIIRI